MSILINNADLWSTGTTLTACLIDGHSCLIVVYTREYKVYSRLALLVTDAGLESLKAIYGCDVHVIALKLDVRVDAAEGLSSSICLGQT